MVLALQSPEGRQLMPTEEVAFARVQESLRHIEGSVDEIKQNLAQKYVTKDQFEPVRLVVYGLVALILVGVLGALVALVIQNPV